MWKDSAKYSGGTSPGEICISNVFFFLGNSAPVAFTLEKAADFWQDTCHAAEEIATLLPVGVRGLNT